MSRKYTYNRDVDLTVTGAVFAFIFFLTVIAGWITHIVWIIKLLSASSAPVWNQVILAVIGALVPPVGVVHGIIIWFS